jgi:hypothetical protein
MPKGIGMGSPRKEVIVVRLTQLEAAAVCAALKHCGELRTLKHCFPSHGCKRDMAAVGSQVWAALLRSVPRAHGCDDDSPGEPEAVFSVSGGVQVSADGVVCREPV